MKDAKRPVYFKRRNNTIKKANAVVNGKKDKTKQKKKRAIDRGRTEDDIIQVIDPHEPFWTQAEKKKKSKSFKSHKKQYGKSRPHNKKASRKKKR